MAQVVHDIINIEKLNQVTLVNVEKPKHTRLSLNIGRVGIKGEDGIDGVTFTPSIKDNVLSWTNNSGYNNPASFNFASIYGIITNQEIYNIVSNDYGNY